MAAITRGAAMEWAEYGIRCNAVASGGVLTEMTMSLIGDNLDKATALVPTGRLSEPEEVARLVAFYASDAATNVTGQIFVIDSGGYGAQADPGYLTPEQIAAYARIVAPRPDEIQPVVTRDSQRWWTLAGSVLAGLCVGFGYAWSVLLKPMAATSAGPRPTSRSRSRRS